MKHVIGLQDMVSGRMHGPEDMDRIATHRFGAGVLDIVLDYDAIGRQVSRESLRASDATGMWRYRALLPIREDAAVPPLPVGATPLCPVPMLGRKIGVPQLWIKDEGRQPTGSLKDRASALAVIKARERRASVIATASTGNAAAALSGLCASVGQQCVIFVPATAPEAKIAQLLAFGAQVLLVEGTYDHAFDLCQEACARYGWYNRNTGYNPYMSEGKKTVAYEICEQLGWQVPDHVFVGVGDGSIIGGLYKGFRDLLALGWIDRMPRLTGVQAAGSDYLYQAWRSGCDILTKPAIEAHTKADSLHAALPRDRVRALKAVLETSGAFLRIEDDALLQAVGELARSTGVFAEPAGAAAYAGLVEALRNKSVDAGERVVLVNTGNGLKDVASVMQGVDRARLRAVRLQPDLEELDKIIRTTPLVL